MYQQKRNEPTPRQTYLEMRTRNRLRKLVEQRLLNLSKLCRVHNLENVLDFIEEHDLLGAVDFRPVAKKAQYHLNLR